MEDAQISEETRELLQAVDDFAESMKQRLIQKAGKEGYSGWKDYTPEDTLHAIEERLPRLIMPNNSGEIGIANWALIHHLNRKRRETNGTSTSI